MQFKFTYIRLLIDQADFPACFNFYKDVMGFAVTWGQADEDYAEFDSGATRIAINTYQHVSDALGTSNKPFAADIQDHSVLIFEVESVDEAFAELSKHGAVVASTPQDRAGWGVRTAHFRDPAGNLIEINQSLQQE
jgi:lactoylglutathione lyase